MGPLDVHLADDSLESLLREGILDVGEEFILQKILSQVSELFHRSVLREFANGLPYRSHLVLLTLTLVL